MIGQLESGELDMERERGQGLTLMGKQNINYACCGVSKVG